MDLSVSEIAQLVGGKVEGQGTTRIKGVAPLESAGATDISFLKSSSLKDSKQNYETSQAGAVLVSDDLPATGRTLIRVSNPMAAIAMVLGVIEKEKNPARAGRHPTAVVAEDAKIGPNCYLGPHSVIESEAVIGEGAQIGASVYVGARSVVGANTILHPHVVIREDSQIGARCVIQPNAVIGGDGYGFFFAKGKHNKIPQIGTVVLEDDVEVGACTTIDRAMIGETRIGKGTKIDNLVQIAHNVVIGQHSLIVAQVGIAGSARIGNGVVIAGQAGVSDHVTIGDGVQIGGQAGVKTDLAPGGAYWGTPAIPLIESLKHVVLLRKLPKILKGLEKK